jgi:hypothetical protein
MRGVFVECGTVSGVMKVCDCLCVYHRCIPSNQTLAPVGVRSIHYVRVRLQVCLCVWCCDACVLFCLRCVPTCTSLPAVRACTDMCANAVRSLMRYASGLPHRRDN